MAWGTYDLGKPRTRILLRGLREQGIEVIECHTPLWQGIEDKSRMAWGRWILVAARWLAAYPRLLARYLRCPPHDLVLVGYPGALDVLVIRPWAGLRRVPVVWDVFIPLYDAVVEDRGLLSARHPAARLLRHLERSAARRAARVLLDTRAQAEHFGSFHRLPEARVGAVPVGVEPEFFAPGEPEAREPWRGSRRSVRVLFYGQMIPLHGIDTVLQAALSPAGRKLSWRIVGDGQQGREVERALRGVEHEHVRWSRWVPYERLRRELDRADVCLGIFGTTPKAARVVPNKVYQGLAAGKPLVTRDGPAIREVLAEGPAVRLIPAGDPEALVAAIVELASEAGPGPHHRSLLPSLLPAAVGRRAQDELSAALSPPADGATA